ncbi:hypothetical protein NIES4072_63820 [Nostoc commune NIES-4072]|uniref:Uncharacterized protein n=1 Tax=Nostoc commune NIES-4072 TaxID=2005467 RepID=A0A2R5FV91_NOSCO|nr:hypothetical protein [Nostoc commune]BBD66349.1 hypothetical protein NIES4070_27140 [Nostoc commune HK-02]GBG22670.1 hypothetical protein NIES4072_63820 [Nostoc commune NIES-4072]
MKDNTPLFLALAGIGVLVWTLQQQSTPDFKTQLTKCQAEFEGFKNGVIYRR